MKLQEEYNIKRTAYLANEIQHHEFYLWLADSIGVRIHNLPVSVDRIKQSKDDHLNDIPLQLWDRCDSVVRGLAIRAGMRAWSLCDTVCVLKNYARREAQRA